MVSSIQESEINNRQSKIPFSLATWVTQITADPERSEDATGTASASHGLGLMNEFFHPATAQPRSHPVETAPAHKTIRERLWVKFLNRFKPAQTKTPSGPSSAAFAPWRNRASELSGRYSGLYRGTYFLNHLLALAALKLWIVFFVFRSTHAAIHGEWNDRAVDFRYISERLRALNYLPLIGSFQPPAAAPAQYTSRVVRHSAVDWLFDAIIRSVSPAQFAKDAEIRSFEPNARHSSPSSH